MTGFGQDAFASNPDDAQLLQYNVSQHFIS
jgi:hypothetical protein